MIRGLIDHVYVFKPRRGYWFTYWLYEELSRSSGCIEASLDLGLSKTRICVYGGSIAVSDTVMDLGDIKPSSNDRVVFYDLDTGEAYEVIRRGENGGFYKLKIVYPDKAPTIEINGIHMHRIKDIDPWSDAYQKVRVLGVKRGERILDTCMGLGYTAIHSLRRGAGELYTFEIDENVLWIAEHNPWSRKLGDPRVRIVKGDIVELIKKIPDEYFNKIIHDPPRYSPRTGDLYGEEFYRELYRVLRPGGRLFHYTGEPRRHGSPSIVKGVGERLRRAGFYQVRFIPSVQGYIAVKPLI